MRTACGSGSMDNPEHLKACLVCNSAAWSDYRREHPGPVRRFFYWLGEHIWGGGGLPVPPGSEASDA